MSHSMNRNRKKICMLIIGYSSLVACFVGLWILLNPIIFANSLILVKKIDRIIHKKSSSNPIIVVSQAMPTPKPVDPATLAFSLYIAKIDLEAKVMPNIDATDSQAYKAALKQGVAHAKGTAFPGQGKLVYIFGHSTDYAWNVETYNALFYQIKDLEIGDPVVANLGEQKYIYKVIEKKIVDATDMSLLEKNIDKDVLVLQTCYPPGTTWKRLLIVASQKPSFESLISYK